MTKAEWKGLALVVGLAIILTLLAVYGGVLG
jgi:hypothetical protein